MILVTGATGFLGSHFINQIAKKSHSKVLCMIPDSQTVRMAGRNISENELVQSYAKLGISTMKYPAYGQLADYKKAVSGIRKITAVVYMAANNNQNAKYGELYRDNVDALRLFIESLGDKLDGAKFIFTSSIMSRACSELLDSGFKADSLKKINPYGLSKLMAEKLILNYSKKFNFDPLILRLSSLYGKNSATGLMFSVGRLAKFSKKFPIPYFPGKTGIVEVSDVATLIERLLSLAKSCDDVYYYADNRQLFSLGNLIRYYGVNHGFKTKQFKLPKFAAKLISNMSLIGLKLGIAPALKLLALFQDVYAAYDTRIWNVAKVEPKGFAETKKIGPKKNVKENGVRVAITGATGMLGQKVVTKLLDGGFIVRCGIHKGSNITNIPQNMELAECNVRNADSVESFVRGQDVVIHAAALTTAKKYKKSDYFKTNVLGTSNVIAACLKYRPKKLIFFASEAAHPSAKGYYGISKYLAEKKIKEQKFDWVIVKFGQVVGKGTLIQKLAAKIKNGAVFLPIPSGTPKNLELVDSDSIVEGVAQIVGDGTKKYTHKIVYFGCAERVNVDQVVDNLCEKLHKKPFKIRLPEWFFRVVALMPLSPLNSNMIDSLYTPLPDIQEENSIRMADVAWEDILERYL